MKIWMPVIDDRDVPKRISGCGWNLVSQMSKVLPMSLFTRLSMLDRRAEAKLMQ
jgi:hypothetical protein